MNGPDDKQTRQVVLLDFSMASLKREPAPEYATRRYLDAPAPGITTADRVLRKLLEACESVRHDIAQHGHITHESKMLVETALVLANRR